MYLKVIELRKIIKTVSLVLAGVFFLFIIYQSPWIQRLRYPMPYRNLIQQYAYMYEIDPYLVAAIMREESKFMPKSLSTAGARGLMQLMPETANWVADQMKMKDFSQELLYQPETNIKMGAWYLANLSKQFDNNTVLVLAAYNGGRGRVKEWISKGNMNPQGNIEEIPLPETKEYVKRVLKSYDKYRRLYPEKF